QEADEAARDRLVTEFGVRSKFVAALYENEGGQLAGPKTILPKEVAEEVHHPGTPVRPGRPGEPDQPGRKEPQKKGMPAPSSRTSIFMIRTKNPTRHWIGVRLPGRNLATGGPMRTTLVMATSSLITN